ncbi:MAG: hypothetical protein UDB69_04130, partial [Faecalibacterium sp.]|nr:hypothetical protein [Faecalibacterium sp.]
MAMDLAVQTFSMKPEYLIAGTDIRITTAVKEAGAALTRGMVVCLADGNPIVQKVTGTVGAVAGGVGNYLGGVGTSAKGFMGAQWQAS